MMDDAVQPEQGPIRVDPWSGSPGRRAANAVAVLVAAALQLGIGFVSLTSGLVAPTWAWALLVAAWFGFLVLLARTARRRPLYSPLVPIANALFWLAVISAGGYLLGWQA